MKKFKIVFTVSNDLRQDQRMHRICSSLAADGFDIVLVGKRNLNSPTFHTDAFKYKQILSFSDRGILFYIEYNIRLLIFLAISRFDGICSIDLDTIIPVSLISWIKRKIHFHDAHEYFEESIEIINRPVIKAFWAWVGNTFIPKADHHYTVNNTLANLFQNKYKRSFEYILNVPEGRFDIPQKQDKPHIVLYQGVLNEGRGLELLVQAAQSLTIELWIVGEGKLRSNLEDLVNKLALSSKVKFWGFKTGEELRKLTIQADIGVNILDPSSGNYKYSLANRTFDFIQAGLPAIHMDFPEYKKINNEYHIALLINQYNTTSIKDALSKMIEDKTLYQDLKANCKVAAKHLNWESEQEKLKLLYRKWTGFSL